MHPEGDGNPVLVSYFPPILFQPGLSSRSSSRPLSLFRSLLPAVDCRTTRRYHRLFFACIAGNHNFPGTMQPDQAPPLSEAEQKARDKTLNFAKKELKKLGKAGLAEIKRMTEEEKV